MKSKLKTISLYIFGIFFITAGLFHFLYTNFFLTIMPPYIPWHLEFVYLSGVVEVMLGAGLMYPRTRKFSAYGIIALLIAVFPANIYMAFNNDVLKEMNTSAFIAQWVRLPFQFVLIAIAYWLRKD